MTLFLFIAAWAAAVAVLAPALVLFAQTLASFLPVRKIEPHRAPGSVAVIVPAHNESRHMMQTLQDLRRELRDGDRLIVVADNCKDDTAAVAAELGAEVLVRHDETRRGKGYALQFAVDHLRDAPAEIVAFFDADCRVEPDALTRLAAAADKARRPAQALYIMTALENAPPRTSVAAFAWVMINHVRMTGLFNLAGVTRFTGSGMAAPWDAIAGTDFATGAINEDLVLTFAMTKAGFAPLLEPRAVVTSPFPDSDDAGVTQRARWEHGSLNLLLRQSAPAFLRGVVKGNARLAMLALDAMIPPLVVFAAMLVAVLAVTLTAASAAGLTGPFMAALTACLLFAVSLALGWAAHGRKVLPLGQIWGVAPFLLQKLSVYGGKGRASSRMWTRTKRGGEDEAP